MREESSSCFMAEKCLFERIRKKTTGALRLFFGYRHPRRTPSDYQDHPSATRCKISFHESTPRFNPSGDVCMALGY